MGKLTFKSFGADLTGSADIRWMCLGRGSSLSLSLSRSFPPRFTTTYLFISNHLTPGDRAAPQRAFNPPHLFVALVTRVEAG